jgi:formiminotetrahydrofolate cyclodeaminase
MDDDAVAFEKVMAAFKTPRDDPQRKAKIQAAMVEAAETPLQTARTCLDVLRKAAVAAERGNRNAASDAGTAAALARAAIRGAAYNVRINVESIKDEETARGLTDALEAVEKEAEDLSGSIP